jgi:uncharacterized protein YndB with AHSA1/START domain
MIHTVVNPPGTAAGSLVLQRVFAAPPEIVFAAWSDPTHVAEWWHPKGFTTPVFEMDFRVGGRFRYGIRSARHDGWAHGTYREIEAPHRIVFTFQWEGGPAAPQAETLITLTFEPRGDDTLLTFRQEPFASDAARHSHGQGWHQVLEHLDAFLASRKVSS